MKYLYPFQEEVLPKMAETNFLLADDCGLGKTVTAVEFGKRTAQGPILVICPRLVKAWWAQEIQEQEAGYPGICGRAGRGIPWERVGTGGR